MKPEPYSELTHKAIRVEPQSYVDPRRSLAFLPHNYTYGVYVKKEVPVKTVYNVLQRYGYALKVYLSEEFYSGPYVNRAPDLTVFPRFNRGYTLSGSNVRDFIINKSIYYDHHPNGILIVSSDVWRPSPQDINYIQGCQDHMISLLNHIVTPLSFYLLKLPIPKDSDSKDLLSILCSDAKFKDYSFKSKWKILKRLYHTRVKGAFISS